VEKPALKAFFHVQHKLCRDPNTVSILQTKPNSLTFPLPVTPLISLSGEHHLLTLHGLDLQKYKKSYYY